MRGHADTNNIVVLAELIKSRREMTAMTIKD
jgi:hypothetical protein